VKQGEQSKRQFNVKIKTMIHQEDVRKMLLALGPTDDNNRPDLRPPRLNTPLDIQQVKASL